jgi:hypothetical protein
MIAGTRVDIRATGENAMMRNLSPISTTCLLVAMMWALAAAMLCVPSVVAAVPARFRLGNFEFLDDSSSRINLGVGGFSISQQDDRALEGRVELRLGEKIYAIGPLLGIMANTDGGVFGYVGIYTDIRKKHWVVTPSTDVGGYAKGGSKDLGGIFQFRLGIEIAREFDNGSRLGIGITHISNAGIHDSNPGVESISLFYSTPLRRR